MGNWTLLSAEPLILPREDVYGNKFSIRFRMKYAPTRLGTFTETPRLEWNEVILMAEHHKGEWWQYIGDQYARNPHSNTFRSWVNRYKDAYYFVRQNLREDAPSRLYDTTGNRLGRDAFGRQDTPRAQADVVRDYLKRNGGILDVMVEDKPGINKPQPGSEWVHKERLLSFDCGLKGYHQRIYAYQYLNVDSDKNSDQWTRLCKVSRISPPLSTTGLMQTDPPPDVTIVKPFTGSAQNGDYQ